MYLLEWPGASLRGHGPAGWLDTLFINESRGSGSEPVSQI